MAEVESIDFDGALYLAKVHQDSLFLLVTVKGPGSRVVNNLRLLDEHRLLYKVDLNTGTRLLLLDMIVNHENYNFIPFDLTVLDDRNLILAIYYVLRAPDSGISQLYVLDYSSPNPAPKLIISDAWLTAQR